MATSTLIPDLIRLQAERCPCRKALTYRQESLSYAELWQLVTNFASALAMVGIARGDRIAVFLEKRIETVVSLFGAAAAGGVFVPVNPLLRPRQVGYILRDCNVRTLVTSRDRLLDLEPLLLECPDLVSVILVDGGVSRLRTAAKTVVSWAEIVNGGGFALGSRHHVIDVDMAAILYTSGSTGNPKGVVLSHRNMVSGAHSVSQYLQNDENDSILAVLPLSFDAGLSQLTTAFSVGAQVALLNYLSPNDV